MFKKLVKLTIDSEIRECEKCNKKFILSKGFYKKDGYYSKTCKECKRKISKERNSKNFYKRHSFNGGLICDRCGLEIKKTPTAIKGVYSKSYLIDGEWTQKSPLCIPK